MNRVTLTLALFLLREPSSPLCWPHGISQVRHSSPGRTCFCAALILQKSLSFLTSLQSHSSRLVGPNFRPYL